VVVPVEFAVLGPLEATRAGTPIVLGGGRQRALLALMLIHANEVVPAERLVDELWRPEPPAGAAHSLQICVSRLRKALEPERDPSAPRVLVTQTPGYVLQVGPEELDRFRCERLVAEGRRALGEGDPAAAAGRLGDALGLWRGPALMDFAYEPFAQAEMARLGELRVSALEDRVEAELALGRHGRLIGDLEVAARDNPLRERLWAQWMLALYRCGRQSEALRTFQELRAHLGEELGITPSTELVALEEAIVLQKPELDWARPVPQAKRHPRVTAAKVTASEPLTIPETRYARSGDLSIAYQVVGSGPDVVFVPGSISQVELGWEAPLPTSAIWRRLSRFARLVIFDKRGTGLSDRSAGVPTLEERMDDVRAVMDAAQSEKAAVVGISEGGPMAMLFAATYPERVTALVLWGTFARAAWAPDYSDGLDAEVGEQFCEWIEQNWGHGEVMRGIATHDAPDDEATRRHLARFERAAATPQMAAATNRFGLSCDARSALGAISAPTLVVHRTGDPLCPVVSAHYLVEHIRGARLAEFPGDFHLSGAGNDEDILDEIQEFLTGTRHEPEIDRVLKTLLFTDVVESTARVVSVDDRRRHELLDAHHVAVRHELERFQGQGVKTVGDGFLACFDGPARAVRCARAITDEARTIGLEVRAGLHSGECEVRGEDLAGVAVHIGAQVVALASPGEVLVTSTVRDLVTGSNIEFADRGEHELKGVPGTWRLFAVQAV
jgi:DNA-binding SARP family transcriptional activator/class 3 adenylate cyclase